MNILLIGNPNCGKTTIFNALTGANQKVGNWAGVTVEKKTGQFSIQNTTIELTDLPGLYALSNDSFGSQDEQIAMDALSTLPCDLIINVIDACHLERHLYLTSQLLELGKPMLLILNMMDIAKANGISLDTKALSKQLACPVIPLEAHKKIGFTALEEQILKHSLPAEPLPLNLSFTLQPHLSYFQNMRLLEQGEHDIVIADARYQAVHKIVQAVQRKKSDVSRNITARLDKWLLHRYLALPIFLFTMYSMFLFAIHVGGAFQDFFDISSNTVFVQGTAWVLNALQAPGWLIALLAEGVGRGINTTLTFIPVIASLFLFLSFLETTGYMARAAFVVDKIMRSLGLPGKAFVPMIVGFGCNVPAVMAARTLDTEQDRLLTVLMSPFMSCSARLAIYAVFVAAFFPTGGQNIVFLLYVIGILMAVVTGFLLRKTTFQGQASSLILELPVYHRPNLKRLWRDTYLRLRYFITRAAKVIIPVSVLLGGLNALTISGGVSGGAANTQSVLSWFAQGLTPLFAPMGITTDNWPATVGLLTGTLAKEVVIGTLNALYTGSADLVNLAGFDFFASMKEAFVSIPVNLSHVSQALLNPIGASAPDTPVAQSVYGIMASKFDGKAGAFAYMLFILLYIPCISTMAAIKQEATRKLMWFSMAWSLLLAYTFAVIFYQAATINEHLALSLQWIVCMLMLLAGFVLLLYKKGIQLRAGHAITNS